MEVQRATPHVLTLRDVQNTEKRWNNKASNAVIILKLSAVTPQYWSFELLAVAYTLKLRIHEGDGFLSVYIQIRF